MSTSTNNKRTRRRRRNRKIMRHENYTDRFERFKPKYLHNLIWNGYYRELKRETKLNMSSDIQDLCILFLPLLTSLEDEHINKIISSICDLETYPAQPSQHNKIRYAQWMQQLRKQRLQIIKSNLKFDEKFNSLWSYQRRIICHRIVKINKWPITNLVVEKADNSSIYELMLFVEYILLNCKTITYLNLSNMSLNDAHILSLCHTIENITNHWSQSKQKTKKKSKTKKNMALNEINLSSNKKITDKHLDLLLRRIKKHAPKMKYLRLSDSNITNKSISTIIRHRIEGMQVYLDGCKNISVKELTKYKHSSANVYCASLIHYTNTSNQIKVNKERKNTQMQQMYNQHNKKYYEDSIGVRWNRSDWS